MLAFLLICHPSVDQQPSSVPLLLFQSMQFGGRPRQFVFLKVWSRQSHTESRRGVQMVLLCTSHRCIAAVIRRPHIHGCLYTCVMWGCVILTMIYSSDGNWKKTSKLFPTCDYRNFFKLTWCSPLPYGKNNLGKNLTWLHEIWSDRLSVNINSNIQMFKWKPDKEL